MTPSEREKYVNQDYVPRSYICVDTDMFSDEYMIASSYENMYLPESSVDYFSQFLTDKQVEVIKLRFIKGMTFGKIAEMLGITKTSVLNRLENARKKLKKLYEKGDITLPISDT